MTPTILDEIIKKKRISVEEAKRYVNLDGLSEKAVEKAKDRRNFAAAISTRDRVNIIAEFKRASPSKGVINDTRDPASLAKQYELGGAAAISVLTEEDFFNGSLDDLRAVRAATDLPILRKDFIVDEYQIHESAQAGADAILLILAALSIEDLRLLYRTANGIGLDAVIEVHDLNELEIAASIGARIIGVNNRDLRTFEVSLDVSRRLIGQAPKDAIMISESGLKTREDLLELRNFGYSAFLIGESLMRSGDAEKELRKLTTEDSEATEEHSA
jgi:indole-3-glycerol phosphate synthase